MLTWIVTYQTKPGQRQAFYDAITAQGVGPHSRSEEGNLKYDYYFSAQNEDELLLVEAWTTPELQQAHTKTEVFARLQALKEQYVDHVAIDQFSR